MLYKKDRDMNPVAEYQGYVLGETIMDDSDGFQKHVYEVFELAEMRDYDDGRLDIMYDKIKTLNTTSLDLNVVERFEDYVNEYRKLEYGLELTL